MRRGFFKHNSWVRVGLATLSDNSGSATNNKQNGSVRGCLSMATPFDPQRILYPDYHFGDMRKEPSGIRLEDDDRERTTPVVTSRPARAFTSGLSSAQYDDAGKKTHASDDDNQYRQSVDNDDKRKPSQTPDESAKRVFKREQYPPFDSPLRSHAFRKNHNNGTPSVVASRTETTFALNGYSFSQYASENGADVVEGVDHFDEQRPSVIRNPVTPGQDQNESIPSQSFPESSRIRAARSVTFIDETKPYLGPTSFAGAVHERSLLLESPEPLHVAGNAPGSSKYKSSQPNRFGDQSDSADRLEQPFQHNPTGSNTSTAKEIPNATSRYHHPKSPAPPPLYSPQQGIPQTESPPNHARGIHDTHDETSRQPPPISKADYPAEMRTDIPPMNKTGNESNHHRQPTGDAWSVPNPLPKSANDEPADPYQRDALPPPPVMPPIPSMAFGSQREVSSVTMNTPMTHRTTSSHTRHHSPYDSNDNKFAVPKQRVGSRSHSMPGVPYGTDNHVSEPENLDPPNKHHNSNEVADNNAPLTRVELDATLAECESFYESTRTVIDDEDVLREAIKARDIIEKTTIAIATGDFPSAQELEDRLEHMRQSSLTKSPEEKLRQIPVLKEIKKKLAVEQETRDSLSLSSGGPAPQSSIPTDTRSVFISYTGQDAIAAMFAASLSSFLDKSGVLNFFDVSSLRIGELWETEIERSVAECHVFVSVLSPTYPFRKWCMNELDIALRNNKKVIPVCVQSEPYKLLDTFRENFYKAHRAEGLPVERIQQWEENLVYQARIQAARNFSTNKNAFTELTDRVIDAIHANLQGHPNRPLSSTGSPERSKPMVLSRLSKDVSNRISTQVPLPTPARAATENTTTENAAQQEDHVLSLLNSYGGRSPRELGAGLVRCNMLAVRETRPVDPVGFILTEKGDRAAAAAMHEAGESQSPPSPKAPQIDVQNADPSVHAMLVGAVAVQHQPNLAPAVCGPDPGHKQTHKKSFWKRLRGVVPKRKMGRKPEGEHSVMVGSFLSGSTSARAPSVDSEAETHVAHNENRQQQSAPPSHMHDHVPVPSVLPIFKDQVLPGRVSGSRARAPNEHVVTDAWAVDPRENKNDPKRNGSNKHQERDN